MTNSSDNLPPGSPRYALTQANLPGNGGSTVEITPQVTRPIILSAGEPPVNSDMMIRNDSGAPLEIRQTTANERVFHVGAGAGDVTFTGVSAAPLTIDGGSAAGANGGGIVNFAGPLGGVTVSGGSRGEGCSRRPRGRQKNEQIFLRRRKVVSPSGRMTYAVHPGSRRPPPLTAKLFP